MLTETCRRVVIKLGTQIVVDEAAGGPALSRICAVVDETAALVKKGVQVVLVSSGAVGLGRQVLALTGQLELTDKQACAAIGQSRLMDLYAELFRAHAIHVAQILVTAHDFSDRARYLNLRNTFERLLRLGVVPVVNENDVVSVSGIAEDGKSRSFDDNDKLSALVAGKLDADYLLILTNVDGVFDSNPAKNAEARLISRISSIAELQEVDTSGQSSLGRGGMTSKLSAARIAAFCGVKTRVSSGMVMNPITSALSGERGTLIEPREALSNRQRWIGLSSGYNGTVTINGCACKILKGGDKSLLPIGVTAVAGEFAQHEIVSIQDENGGEIGRGITGMSAETLRLVMGKHSEEARAELKPGEKNEVIHRDNLVVFEE